MLAGKQPSLKPSSVLCHLRPSSLAPSHPGPAPGPSRLHTTQNASPSSVSTSDWLCLSPAFLVAEYFSITPPMASGVCAAMYTLSGDLGRIQLVPEPTVTSLQVCSPGHALPCSSEMLVADAAGPQPSLPPAVSAARPFLLRHVALHKLRQGRRGHHSDGIRKTTCHLSV